ncbi:hypothetical protein [Hymenobacter properus]|uniref:Lipoprotein n=1 Tax=Hymenobacter properus TaxID=2791026 RepID=A0A931BG55_9BACT|nr:hypothetical protein [Hymenobacter properus]MBF9141818.1 hypothetical protein [Hymenobacter properus]MBR7720626.1 hypothetical protein [Microvirga sp. SRT04]
MTTAQRLCGWGLGAAGLLLTACDDGPEVRFAQPFPAQAADMASFPPRHRGVYTAADSGKSLCIGRTAVWRQELQRVMGSRRQADSALHYHLHTDTTYEQDGHLHYVHLMGRDSVRDSWLWIDTIFSLVGAEAGKLRRFQGRYYLNNPTDANDKWRVERLEIDGTRLNWQTLGADTLRLLVLNRGTVRYRRENGALTSIRLAPATAAQARQLGRSAGLWETQETYQRRH